MCSSRMEGQNLSGFEEQQALQLKGGLGFRPCFTKSEERKIIGSLLVGYSGGILGLRFMVIDISIRTWFVCKNVISTTIQAIWHEPILQMGYVALVLLKFTIFENIHWQDMP